MVECVELVLAEPTALLVAQRGCNLVLPEPGSDARQVVLVDERQTVGLEEASEVYSDDSIWVDLMVLTVIIFLASGRLAELRRRIQDSS